MEVRDELLVEPDVPPKNERDVFKLGSNSKKGDLARIPSLPQMHPLLRL